MARKRSGPRLSPSKLGLVGVDEREADETYQQPRRNEQAALREREPAMAKALMADGRRAAELLVVVAAAAAAAVAEAEPPTCLSRCTPQ